MSLSTLKQCTKYGCTLESYLANADNEENAAIAIQVDELLNRFASTEEG